MRLAIVATPSPLSDMRAPPGALDGDILRSRLPSDDTAFEVVDIDPLVDLAEQLDTLFEARKPGPEDEILFYVSSPVAVSVDGEFFLCLDPENPQTGDALADVVAVFQDHVSGPVLFVLECRHAPAPADPFRSATVVAAAKDAVNPSRSGIELLIAARPLSHGVEERPSPFTRALIGALDDADIERGLLARMLYERIKEGIVGAVPCFAHARGWTPFALIPVPVGSPIWKDAGVLALADAPSTLDAEALGLGERLEEVTLESEAAEALLGGLGKPLTRVEAVDAPPLGAHASEMSPPSVDVVLDDAAFGEGGPATTLRSRIMPSSASPEPTTPEPTRPEPLPEVSPEAAPIELRSDPPAAYAEATLPEDRSFTRQEESVPRVIIHEPAPPSVAPATTPSPQVEGIVSAPAPRISVVPAEPSAPSASPRASSPPPEPVASPETPPAVETSPAVRHRDVGDAMLASKDHEGALGEYRKALGHLAPGDTEERAELYVRLATAKWGQEKRKEAISNLDKALTLRPEYRPALEALVVLNVAERDFRAVHAAEERLLATLTSETERFEHLMEFGERWESIGSDPGRARTSFERARDIRPEDLLVLGKLRRLYEHASEIDKAIETRRRIAELTPVPRDRAATYLELATYCQDIDREELAIEMLELAIDSDSSMLEPLDTLARILSERQEWSQLEAIYRRALSRLDRLPQGEARRRAAWEIGRRLGLLFRDHLEDPTVALAYFERSVDERPEDLGGHLVVADLARTLGRHERALVHLRDAAKLDPQRAQSFHDLFDVAQKLRQPDAAYAAAVVTTHLGVAESRERFLHDEHKPNGVPRFLSAMPAEGWDLLRDERRDTLTEGVLEAIASAAIAARLEQLASEGRLPALDPSQKQDLQRSTISIVRSFAWGSHFLGVMPPAVYVREDAAVSLVAIPAEEATVLAGQHALRGRTLAELAFLVGRHLTYHVGHHRLLLFYPSLEELSACFVSAIAIALPDEPIPAKVRDVVLAYKPLFEAHLDEERRAALEQAVSAFAGANVRPDLPRWAAAVERCATRAGYMLCGSLEVASTLLRAEPRGTLDAETKIVDLIGFTVSEAHGTLREAMGISVQP
ncbi:tetratricopeptide repeat protein [Polyangium spumosum]|uniref:Tetratricopeptide repeat protein n=1 Tax=Polyangium spumosum TaxID=889282 RepID=A0A6N7PGD5_9BACT|nr:tetratricopeptide repeat protein [Polyangium spumosum]MRG91103.1 tetratricopeptide repeat protein [Polyangium spumosum]